MKKDNIFDLNYFEIEQIIQGWEEPAYRALQIWEGLYQQYWTTPDQFSNLPLSLRNQLDQNYILTALAPDKILSSDDGETTKYLFRLSDGAAIETVLMSYSNRNTVCISSQVGCAMGCDFCATGNMGFTRNLSAGEIVEQVIRAAQIFRSHGRNLTNLVFMGMGEPFHNYDAVLKSIDILNDQRGLSLGARRMTISTVGLVPGIRRFAAEGSQVNLAISLHAADDQLRSTLMPVNKKYPLLELMAACQDYILKTRRRVSIEWALIDRVNDMPEQAYKLAELIKGKLFHVNLIRLNPVKHYSGSPTGTDQAAVFQNILIKAGIQCTFRVRRGLDIQAGCGQLASESGS